MNFIDAHDFSVDLVLRVLGVAASTYYGWRARRANPSSRAREDAELLGLIDEIRGQSEFAGTYGSPRVWLELRKRGVKVGRKRVERIMRVNGRQGAYLPKGWKRGSTRQNPKHTAAPDLLDRDFSATAPNQKWVADLTRIPTLEGVLWLASVRDVFSNKVVGWDSSSRATTELVCSALDYAIFSRDVRDGQLIHHSDKGCQGGFNWSSQHLVITEVLGGSSTASSRSSDPPETSVAGSSEIPTSYRGGFLGADRQGPACRRSRGCCRRGAGGRGALVPQRWRHVTVRPEVPALGPLPGLRREGGDRTAQGTGQRCT